jgi:hypothetical protein
MRFRWNALPATLVALVIWLAVAVSMHLVVGPSA